MAIPRKAKRVVRAKLSGKWYEVTGTYQRQGEEGGYFLKMGDGERIAVWASLLDAIEYESGRIVTE